jgi:hypothetical protein
VEKRQIARRLRLDITTLRQRIPKIYAVFGAAMYVVGIAARSGCLTRPPEHTDLDGNGR